MEISLRDFLSEYGNSLKKKVIDSLKPLFNPKKKDSWDREAELRLEELKRKPFPAQTKAILALAKGFFMGRKKGLVLVGEMGTGKTEMAIAVSHLIPKRNYRVLVMCPPHLVQKWMREIEITLPKCRVVNLNGKGLKELEDLRHARKPACPEFYVIGRERAKNHYRCKTAVTRQRHLDRMLCPVCGKDLDVLRGKRPRCPDCEQPLYEADRDGMRRFAKAEFIKKYLKGKFDLFVADEVHELKGGTTAQGQALADLACTAKRTLALTGTLMGGYSTNLFYIFWRLMPREMKEKKLEFRSPMGFAEAYGIIERALIEKKSDEYNETSIGRNGGTRTVVKERPGVSPLVLTDFLLEHSVFMRLPDISEALPPFDEKVVEVSMTEDQYTAYKAFEDTLKAAVRDALRKRDKSLLGALVNSLLAYPDGARRGEIVIHPHTEALVAEGPPIDEHILPKENQLLDIVSKELAEGRKCLVCLEHTGTRDLIPDLQERLNGKGVKPLILRAGTVSTEKREAWVRSKMKTGEYDVMIANPNLIKTGLDLIEFPTIIFFQTGYSIFTLRQASRRSWRIGQNIPVRVYYLSYAETMQAVALSLIATKLETALAIEGDLSDKGLATLAEGANSMLIEMAKTLLDGDKGQSVSEAWKKYKKKEIITDSFIGDDVPEIETTTTTITKGDRSTSVTYEKVVRGRVYPRNGYAVAYVNKHKFFFKAGQVFFNGKPCGTYDKKGMGQINNKPVQIMKAPDKTYYVLVELK
jgi:SNF2 family DNA or RNA helicase